MTTIDNVEKLKTSGTERAEMIERMTRGKLRQRQAIGRIWQRVFFICNVIAILALVALFLNVINQAFGLISVTYTLDPATLTSRPLEELSSAELSKIMEERLNKNRLVVIIRDSYLDGKLDTRTQGQQPLAQLLPGRTYPEGLEEKPFLTLTVAELARFLEVNLDRERLQNIVTEQVLQPLVAQSWTLFDSILNRSAIEASNATARPNSRLEFRAWANPGFLARPASTNPFTVGLRTAFAGTILIILITLSVALPLGVGAAIYLEEYATDNWINRLIETNIRNLAGVPSIIYGMLGLAIFVFVLTPITSGAIFGVTGSSGRTALSAGLTMALLILPVIIVNAQEAIRAVPRTVREASFGIGATKWQTIWRQVLPAALPGTMTGLILAMSRAIGETAPLIVVGAATSLTSDPNGPFSSFTVIPIQIYQWTSRPEPQFKNAAAAAIIVLLIVLLALNTVAILLRQRFSKSLGGY